MTYQAFLGRLDRLVNYEKVAGYDYDLAAFTRFLENFGSPERRLKNVILVGGTKGKGSTCAMLESILRHCGYRTGLYSSPHLVRINERIRVDGRPIGNDDFVRLGEQVLKKVERTSGGRSFFEALTAVAFLYFIEEELDYTILEVGLGGRLDATNVSSPIVTAITRIGLDHTNLLGKTLEKIAGEKAGIMRRGVPLVIGFQKPRVREYLVRQARIRQAPVSHAGSMRMVGILSTGVGGTSIRIGERRFKIPLAGRHQIENLLTVLKIVDALRGLGHALPERAVREGVKHTLLAGRVQVWSRRPLVILDGAHNADSFRALLSVLESFSYNRLFLVFGITCDKDPRVAYRGIFPMADRVILTRADFPRAKEPAAIRLELGVRGRRCVVIEPVNAAVQAAIRAARPADCVVIFGSFYVVGEALKALRR